MITYMSFVSEDMYHANRTQERYVVILEFQDEDVVRTRYESRSTLDECISKRWKACGKTGGQITHVKPSSFALRDHLVESLQYALYFVYIENRIYTLLSHEFVSGSIGTSIVSFLMTGNFADVGLPDPYTKMVESVAFVIQNCTKWAHVPLLANMLEPPSIAESRTQLEPNPHIRLTRKIMVKPDSHPHFAMYFALQSVAFSIPKEKLNVVSAMPFQDRSNTLNNIGIINYEYERATETKETFQRKMLENKWQVVASRMLSEHPLPGVPDAQTVRQMVDIVYSYIVIKDPSELSHLHFFSWNQNAPDTPYKLYLTGFYDKPHCCVYVNVEVLDNSVDISKLEQSGFKRLPYIL